MWVSVGVRVRLRVEFGVEYDQGVGTLNTIGLVLLRAKKTSRHTFNASHALIISCSPTHGNSYKPTHYSQSFHLYNGKLTSTPDSIKKHLNPFTPASQSPLNSSSFPGTSPPQNPKSQLTPTSLAHALFVASPERVVVGGIELRGMSIRVVIPPDMAASVPVRKPSQAVRPGWFRWTWVLKDKFKCARWGGG